MERKKIFLIDPSQLFREGLKGLLKGSKLEVVRDAPDLQSVPSAVTQAGEIDLLILDFKESDGEGPNHLKSLRERFPGSRIVILTTGVSTLKLVQALDAGADGYLLKDMSSDALIRSLNLVLLGEKVFPTHLARLLIEGKLDVSRKGNGASLNGLSERELQILRCLVNGDPNKVIANRLRITEATVKVHIKGVLRKIPASNRTQAAIWAIEHGVGRQHLEAVAG